MQPMFGKILICLVAGALLYIAAITGVPAHTAVEDHKVEVFYGNPIGFHTTATDQAA